MSFRERRLRDESGFVQVGMTRFDRTVCLTANSKWTWPIIVVKLGQVRHVDHQRTLLPASTPAILRLGRKLMSSRRRFISAAFATGVIAGVIVGSYPRYARPVRDHCYRFVARLNACTASLEQLWGGSRSPGAAMI